MPQWELLATEMMEEDSTESEEWSEDSEEEATESEEDY
jgi:hypothetical protein